MKSKITKVVLASKEDSLAKELTNYFDKSEYLLLTPENVINGIEIYDEINQQGAATCTWEFNDTRFCWQNLDFALNRIRFLSKELFDDFIDKDKDYARSEFTAYLTFVLNSSAAVFNKAIPGHLCGYEPTCIEQFLTASTIDISIPKICSTTVWEEAISFAKQNNWKIISKDNPYYTKKCRLLNTFEKNKILNDSEGVYHLVEKIEGEPFFVTIIKGSPFITRWQNLSSPKKSHMPSPILNKILRLNDKFNLNFSEIKMVKNKKGYFFQYISALPFLELNIPWQKDICIELLKGTV